MWGKLFYTLAPPRATQYPMQYIGMLQCGITYKILHNSWLRRFNMKIFKMLNMFLNDYLYSCIQKQKYLQRFTINMNN